MAELGLHRPLHGLQRPARHRRPLRPGQHVRRQPQRGVRGRSRQLGPHRPGSVVPGGGGCLRAEDEARDSEIDRERCAARGSMHTSRVQCSPHNAQHINPAAPQQPPSAAAPAAPPGLHVLQAQAISIRSTPKSYPGLVNDQIQCKRATFFRNFLLKSRKKVENASEKCESR